ncbi:hypothetical protein [Oryzicola mucosus]|uniref:DUF1127 domain-containing protein n=1 Tax=Oryzicola mucosus TaxID=2767425 RepID=A0A8J6U449_9HYPH|nr:hypothetical protein [Oryzicola mucosus]MBD0413620.1 hypothetical protein [Oryzicola mucosus]
MSICETHTSKRSTGFGAILLLLLRAPFRLPRRKRIVDLRTLPDHLQRDVGVIDGKDPTPRRR